jgi:hypothetical protein
MNLQIHRQILRQILRQFFRPKFLRCYLQVCFLTICSFDGAFGEESSLPPVTRDLRVRHAELLDNGSLRIFASASELQDKIAFPLATLDRSAFQLYTNVDGDVPLRPSSLSTFATLTPPQRRALVVAWQESEDMPLRLAAEIRKAIAEVLPEARMDLLSVIAGGGGVVKELARITPSESENLKAIQRTILDSVPLGPDQGPTQLLCAAADRFEEWRPGGGWSPADQKVLVGVFGLGDPSIVDPARTLECWRRLEALGVMTNIVSFDTGVDGAPAVKHEPLLAGGGHHHQVRSPLDVYPALSNVLARLNDEYVLDFPLPDYAGMIRELVVELKASYHGNVLAAKEIRLELPIIQTAVVSAGPHWAEITGMGTIILVVVLSGLVLWWKIRARARTVECSLCASRVQRDWSDCPYRSAECKARLVVIGGPNVGVQYALKLGENSIGSSASSSVRLAGGSGARRNHGTLTINERRAVYDGAIGQDRINGWVVWEPRVLATGSVIRIGSCHLRFEAKPEA